MSLCKNTLKYFLFLKYRDFHEGEGARIVNMSIQLLCSAKFR